MSTLADSVSDAIDEVEQEAYTRGLEDGYDKGYEEGQQDSSGRTYSEGYEHAIQDLSYAIPDWVAAVKPNAMCPMGPHRLGTANGSCEFCQGVLPLLK